MVEEYGMSDGEISMVCFASIPMEQLVVFDPGGSMSQ